jgi:hypothetical protein
MFRGRIAGDSDSLAFLSVSPFGTYGFVRTESADYVISSGSHAAPQPPRATAIADLSGVVAGAALMTVTGYFGHRHFTYRTVKQGQM